LKKVIEAAPLLMPDPIVGTFIGKDKNKTCPAGRGKTLPLMGEFFVRAGL
jgi:hypothetical protein